MWTTSFILVICYFHEEIKKRNLVNLSEIGCPVHIQLCFFDGLVECTAKNVTCTFLNVKEAMVTAIGSVKRNYFW